MLTGNVDMRAASGGEAAFSLIELIVGMVLSLIVLGMLFAAVLDIAGSSDRTNQRAKAQKAAVKASDILTNDLRAARAPDRTPRKFGSPDSLRRMLLGGSTLVDVHDIRDATATRLRFYADMDSDNAGSECVTWEMAIDRSIMRRVAQLPCPVGAGATGPELSASAVIPPVAADAVPAVASAQPFRYRLLVSAAPPTCKTVNPPAGASMDQLMRDQIIGVDLDLRAFVSRAGARGDQRLVTSVSVSSRQSLEYRYALGCAE